MSRFKNSDWNLPANKDGGPETWDAVKVAVLMDIRDEMKQLNALLACPNFLGIPHTLKAINGELVVIRRQTKKAKRRPKVKP